MSSTRGLKVRTVANTAGQALPRQDLNQKLGLCPIVSRNLADTKGRPAINWELNERISLSSGSSTGLEVRPDARRGIEFSGNRKMEIDGGIKAGREDKASRGGLELMNVSEFQDPEKKRRRSWSIEIDVIERPEQNVIKSDSKYEIGIPSEGSASRKPKQRRQLSGSSRTQKSAKNEEEEVVNGKWGRKKVDKTNDAISKRLELIHELNQKILANYERFQQKSKRSQSKEKDVLKEKASLKEKATLKEKTALKEKATLKEKTTSKDIVRSRASSKNEDPKEELYSEIKRKDKMSEYVIQKSQDSLRQRKLDINKFTFSKDHCEKLTRSKDSGNSLDKKRSSRAPKSRFLCDNENFIMAARPGFCDPDGKARRPATATEYCTRPRRDSTSVFYAEPSDHVDEAISDDADCLGSSRLYPETYPRSNEAKIDGTSEDCRQTSASKGQGRGREETRDTTELNWDETVNKREEKDGRAIDQDLEREILGNLDETIERFDNDR